jgi:radical SAM superfamily enzyme YgiQ (UPF0313 family)
MYQANFKTIRLSFETANEARRKDMSNKISNNGMLEAVTNLLKAGFEAKSIDAYIIMGIPNQSLEEILQSMLFVNNLGVRISLSSYSPIPGTLDFDRAVASGRLAKDVDPLLTNKSIFPLNDNELDYDTFRSLRILGELLNKGAEKKFSPFGNSSIGKSLKKIIREIN